MIHEKLCVVVPAFNEDEQIYGNLLAIDKSLARWHGNYRIVVVSDGSADDTKAECERAAAACPRITVIGYGENAGKGYALKTGVAQADDEGYIAFLDADLDLPPAQLEGVYRRMQQAGADVIVGSKLHPESAVEYPSSRKIISFFYYLFIRVLFGLKVHDTQTGIKIFRAACLKPIMKQILVKRFAYDIEVLAVCNRRKYNIAEAPIELRFTRGKGLGRIRLKDIYHTAWDTLAVFYHLILLRYYD